MFSLSDSDRFYLYPHPTDMRKSFYTLSGIVTNQMGRNVQDGDACIFVNKACTTMKILHSNRPRTTVGIRQGWRGEVV